MEVSGQFHIPTTSLLEKSDWYPFNRMFIRTQSQYGYFGEEKNVLPLLGIEPQFLSCPVQLVA
jgi:hypothetical protein